MKNRWYKGIETCRSWDEFGVQEEVVRDEGLKEKL